MEAGQYGHTMTPEIEAAYEKADSSLLSIVRGMIGFDRAEWTATGAAPLPGEVQRFYAGLGLKVIDVYGMTETTGAFTGNAPDCYRLGTVGRAEPGAEVRIAEDGEILTRSPLNTSGYLNRPEATAELIDADGWVHTGDIGTVDEDGFYRVVDRKKELIITAERGEHLARRDREPPQGAPADRPGARVRRPPPLPGGHPHPRRRDRPRLGAVARHLLHHARRPGRAPGRAQRGGRRGGDGQREAGPGAADQEVGAAGHRVDARERGADAQPQAQAAGGAQQVRRSDREPLHRLSRFLPSGACVVAPVMAERFLPSCA
ncbi:AMP-binding protein [Nonomuraea ferruginea]